MTVMLFIAAIIIGYLIGSLNSPIIISRILIGADVRQNGSGNAGASNMGRTYGTKYGVISFVTDFAKVIIAFYIVYAMFRIFDYSTYVTYSYFVKVDVGFACFLGHIFPCYFGFKGGKGITVCAAMICIIDWRMFLFGLTLFVIVMLISKYISLSSVIFGLTYPIFTLLLFDTEQYGAQGANFKALAVIIAAAFGAIVVIKHKENIKRMINKTENKFELHSKKA